MSHARGYPLIKDALRRAGLDLPPDADPPSKQARAAERREEKSVVVKLREWKLPPELRLFISPSKSSLSRKRVWLWYLQGGLCFWCHSPMILVEPNRKGRLPWNACTVDHLRSRLDPTRRQPARNQEQRLVGACHKCNAERGAREAAERDARTPPQELWLRNGNFYGIAKMAGALNEIDESWNARGRAK